MHLLLLFCTSLGLTIPPTGKPRTFSDYAHEFGPGMNMNVPKAALSLDDLECWAHILMTSTEQTHLIQVMYARHVERHNAFMDREAPQYCAQSAELHALMRAEGQSTPGVVAFARQVDRENARMRRELTLLEHAFIDEISPFLADHQLDRLPLARAESTRRNCRTFLTFGRWANMELRDIWHASSVDLISLEEQEQLTKVFDDYEMRLTPLVCRQADFELEARSRLGENRIAMNSGTIPGDVGQSIYLNVIKQRRENARRVRLLHEQTLSAVVHMLGTKRAFPFLQAAKQAAYPELHPDPDALHAVFDALVRDQTLEDDLRFEIASLADEYQHAHQHACIALEAVCNQ